MNDPLNIIDFIVYLNLEKFKCLLTLLFCIKKIMNSLLVDKEATFLRMSV